MSWTYLYHMEWIEGMGAIHAARAKKLDSDAIEATIHALFVAELALVIRAYPPALESDEFVEENLAFVLPPLLERVILVKMSLRM
jgi:hypothetical protein